jgi:exopolysaccharide biosynthesis polyprenyl glycosylphosphotransferase
MATGFSFNSGLTATDARQAKLRSKPRLTSREVMVTLAGIDLVALVAVATLVLPRAELSWVLGLPVAVVGLLAAFRHYEPRVTPSVAREARSVVACTTTPVVVMALAHVASSAALVEAAVFAILTVLFLHGLANRVIRSMRIRGLLAERTLIVGAGQMGVTFSSLLVEHPEFGLLPVGFLDNVSGESLPLPLFGRVELLRLVLSEERIDRVVVAFGVTREWEMLETIRACEDASVDIHVLPRFFELGVAVDGKDVDDIWGIPLVRLPRSRLRKLPWLGKRVLDVSVAGIGLVVLAPVYLLLAIAVKLSSPGPVHFHQKRVGQHGALVDVCKFRTMHLHEGSDDEWTAQGEHVTRVGNLMRRLSLDEIPQLWSIIRGDMSLVGPRPERPHFVEHFKSRVSHYDARHRVPAGLTGLAQIHGLRGDTSIVERARFDNRYIESWSFWRDVVILFQTVSAVLRDGFARRRIGTSPAAFAADATQGVDEAEPVSAPTGVATEAAFHLENPDDQKGPRPWLIGNPVFGEVASTE